MSLFLLLLAAVLVWFGVDALLLGRHSSPTIQIEKDEMMFGKGHRRPVSDFARSFTERRYPFATGSSMRFYGWLFIAAGVLAAWVAWSLRA